MRPSSIAAAALALAFITPTAADAQIFYSFAATTGSNSISWTYTSNDFITSQTTISAADLDTCNIFPIETCESVILDPYNSSYDLATLFYDDGQGGLPTALTSFFPDGSLDAPGQYDGLNSEFLLVEGTPVAAVPEPASWALMMLGFGAVGFAVGRRRTRGLPLVAHP